MKLRIKMECENVLEQLLFKAEMEYMKALILNDLYHQCLAFKGGVLGRLNPDKERVAGGLDFLENSSDQMLGMEYAADGLASTIIMTVNPLLFEITKIGAGGLAGHLFDAFLAKMGLRKWTPEEFERKLRSGLDENYKGRKITVERLEEVKPT